ncbi:MAG TPA: alpha-L-fucosidase, partial [Arenibacter sp.]|nr:alpha-L-fucosidase [Arenibacter sp.]
NLLFNVGPMPDGRIEQRQIDRLKEMGDWLQIHGDAVYGTRGGPYLPTDHMVSTRKDNKIYLHLFERPEATLTLPFPKNIKIKKAYFLKNGVPLQIARDKSSITINLPEIMPDDEASVIVLDLNRSALDIDLIP